MKNTHPRPSKKHQNQGPVIRIEEGSHVASEFPSESTIEAPSIVPIIESSSAIEPRASRLQGISNNYHLRYYNSSSSDSPSC